MATKIRRVTAQKQVVRFKRKKRIRSRIEGSIDLPRFSVFRSNKNIYAQLIDDVKGHTLVSVSTLDQELKGTVGGSVKGAQLLGDLVAKRAIAKNITKVVFDRNGYLYHGRIKAIADAAREGGLKF